MLVHTAGAAALKCPELELDDDDAKKLGTAFADVAKLHNVVLTPEQEAYMNLAEAVASVYPPMVLSIYLRKKAEKESKRPSATVHPFRPPAPAPRPVDVASAEAAPKPQAPSPPPPVNPREPAPVIVPDVELVPGPSGLNFDPFKIDLPQG